MNDERASFDDDDVQDWAQNPLLAPLEDPADAIAAALLDVICFDCQSIEWESDRGAEYRRHLNLLEAAQGFFAFEPLDAALTYAAEKGCPPPAVSTLAPPSEVDLSNTPITIRQTSIEEREIRELYDRGTVTQVLRNTFDCVAEARAGTINEDLHPCRPYRPDGRDSATGRPIIVERTQTIITRVFGFF